VPLPRFARAALLVEPEVVEHLGGDLLQAQMARPGTSVHEDESLILAQANRHASRTPSLSLTERAPQLPKSGSCAFGTSKPANQTRSGRAARVLAARSAAVVRSWSATLFDHPELADRCAFRRARLAVPFNRLTVNTARTLGLYPRDDITVIFDRIESAIAVTQRERTQPARARAFDVGFPSKQQR